MVWNTTSSNTPLSEASSILFLKNLEIFSHVIIVDLASLT